MIKLDRDPFKEYIKETEPNKRYKAYAWHTAIGLQAVDGLKTSEYLLHTAIRNIEGEISFARGAVRSWTRVAGVSRSGYEESYRAASGVSGKAGVRS